MLVPGPAQRVLIHLNEGAASEGDFLHLEIVSLLFAEGVSGATVLRGHSGFGSHHRIHTQGDPGSGGEHLPIRVEFVEDEVTVKALMPILIDLVTDGVIEVQATTIVHIAQAGRPRERKDRNG
jgi:PII-like signaling protein